ncbi:hypothetical protein D5086_013191 [Populus alba]|uniref:Uncharacterized protein n=1 Tax=Populus alba TaxID=43335 RepID=A0ACC4C489_POPAL
MSVVMATMTGHPLPEDVVIEILSRLPVKNLLQFKCVCKSCCWVKKFSIGPLPEISYPIGHWKNSKLILVSDSGELILCDPSTQEISGLGLTRWVRCVGVFAYKESLVLVNNGKGCEQHKQKADMDSDFVIRSRNKECFLLESYYDEIINLFD